MTRFRQGTIRIIIILISFFISISVSAQTLKIHVKKDNSSDQTYNDTAYFDLNKFALYIKLDTTKIFTSIKQYKVEYKSRKKSGTMIVQGNFFSNSFRSTIINLKVKRIDLSFSNIELTDASPYNKEKKCKPLVRTIYKTKTHRQLYGAGTRFILSPIYRIIYD